MESIFGFFESLFKNFTWGRLTFVALAFILTTGSLVTYEAYTGYLKLTRINTELKIISEIVELEKKIESLPNNSPSKTYFNRLMAEAEKNPMEFNFQPGFATYKLERLSYQSAPWILLLTLVLLTTKTGRITVLAGTVLIASPFIIIGYNLPELEKAWILNWLYPWGTMLITIALIVLWQKNRQA